MMTELAGEALATATTSPASVPLKSCSSATTMESQQILFSQFRDKLIKLQLMMSSGRHLTSQSSVIRPASWPFQI
jgi:hypothetical protein